MLIQVNKFLIKITSKSILINYTQKAFCANIKFENVYSDDNLEKCLRKMNGLLYHSSTDEEKQKFFLTKTKNAKKAAVLVPFCYDELNRPSILFTLRSANLAIHKWEISFPGGKLCDLQDDGDITKTASRETKEELGIFSDSIHIVGVLDSIPGKISNTFIYPVLAKIDLSRQGLRSIEFNNKNNDEVEEVFLRPLDELIKKDNWRFTHWATGITTPVYRDAVFNDRDRPRIWGLSSYILFQVLTNLVPDYFKLKYSTLTRYEN